MASPSFGMPLVERGCLLNQQSSKAQLLCSAISRWPISVIIRPISGKRDSEHAASPLQFQAQQPQACCEAVQGPAPSRWLAWPLHVLAFGVLWRWLGGSDDNQLGCRPASVSGVKLNCCVEVLTGRVMQSRLKMAVDEGRPPCHPNPASAASLARTRK